MKKPLLLSHVHHDGDLYRIVTLPEGNFPIVEKMVKDSLGDMSWAPVREPPISHIITNLTLRGIAEMHDASPVCCAVGEKPGPKGPFIVVKRIGL